MKKQKKQLKTDRERDTKLEKARQSEREDREAQNEWFWDLNALLVMPVYATK